MAQLLREIGFEADEETIKTAPDALFHRHPDRDITTAMSFGKMDPEPDKDNNGNGAYSYQVGMDIYTYGCNPADWFQYLLDRGLSAVGEIQNVDGAYVDFVPDEGDHAKLSNHDNHCPNAFWCATFRNFQMSRRSYPIDLNRGTTFPAKSYWRTVRRRKRPRKYLRTHAIWISRTPWGPRKSGFARSWMMRRFRMNQILESRNSQGVPS